MKLVKLLATMPHPTSKPCQSERCTRQRAIVFFLLFCSAAYSCVGCKKQSMEVDGRTLEEWVALCNGKDASLRIKAYQALRSYPKEKSAQEALLTAVREPKFPSPERYAAALSLFRMTGEAENLIEPVKAAIDAQFGATPKAESTKELEDLVFWLEARAKPLLPTLKQARSRLTGRDAASVSARDGLSRTINSIAGQ